MNKPVPERETKTGQRLAFVDCDIHPAQRTPKELHPYMSAQWREHNETFGGHLCQGVIGQLAVPRMMAAGMRADSYPEGGGPPGSDLAMMQSQHLDLNGCETGNLVVLGRSGTDERNLEFAAALAHAANDWQLQEWVAKDKRLKAGVVVPQEYPEFAVREIDARAAESDAFIQVIISPRLAAWSAQILADLRSRRPQQSGARPASGRRVGRPCH
jgi:predicted TIM-barrel fold metal-dependent hydrolase